MTRPAESFQRLVFGLTTKQAVAWRTCLACRAYGIDLDLQTDTERREYEISGMCGPCQREVFGKGEDDV